MHEDSWLIALPYISSLYTLQVLVSAMLLLIYLISDWCQNLHTTHFQMRHEMLDGAAIFSCRASRENMTTLFHLNIIDSNGLNIIKQYIEKCKTN